jgi:ElaB/YqjD/DUF883 family membrane-anchored ribosome-binding protein
MANAKTTEETSAELGREIKALRDDFTALMATVKEYGELQAAQAAHSARETIDRVGERIRMTADEARERGEAMATEIEVMIARRPLTSVLIALGVGYLIGKLRS